MRTPEQAIATSLVITTGYGGMCLAFVQDCYGAIPRDPSAITAWNNSKHQHPTADPNQVPRGAPIYFAPHGDPYGHVAIYLGNGTMRTTNSATGRIHTDPVSLWTGAYGYRMLGWTSDIEGQPIPNLDNNQQGAPMSEQEMQRIAALTNSYRYGSDPNTVWNYLTGTFNVLQGVTKQIAQLQATLTAQNTAVQALCGSLGADPADIGRIVQDAVKAKLDSIDITVSSAPKQEG
jgi:hypothetical protein